LDARGGGGDGVTVGEDEIGMRESGVRGVLGEIAVLGVVDDEIGVHGESMKRLRTMESGIESFGRRNSKIYQRLESESFQKKYE
jgi:hypothetical protein